MTNEDWKKVEARLRHMHHVELVIDGYKISLYLQRIHLLKFDIIVYVNDELKGEWFVIGKQDNSCLNPNAPEEAKRFYRRKKHYTWPHTAENKKRLPKSWYEKYLIGIHPTWNSFSSMKKHFIKYNKEISLDE